jgi:hypothetical protein
MRYFTYANHRNNPKNKLEEELQEYILSQSRLIIDEDAVLTHLDAVKEKVAQLNHKYKRCKPVEVNLYNKPKSYDTWKDYSLSVANIYLQYYAEQEVCRD